ncbi:MULTISPECIES: hypothetical protein [Halomonadaceae]|uniref:hypothetical protein n=1 Tax=Halomonadaceae TaxID=28256 RepID=UPI00159A811D|nr:MULTISPECIES: hypothetical protein [Halomonas]QJQ95483.1 hypothetical protein HIO72_09470 [Halomonas sp. PA5]
MTLLRAAAVVMLCLLLAACAGAPERPATLRQALFGLSERASARLLEQPVWQRPTADIVLLLAEPEIEARLHIDGQRFSESFTRSLLAQPDSPQVLNWTPEMGETGMLDNQWLLESQLVADGPLLRLTDRELLPYQLTVTLRRPGEPLVQWEAHLQGALDVTAL